MRTNASQTATAVCQHLGYPDLLHVRALNRSGEESSSNYSYIVKCTWNGIISCSFVKATCDLEMFILCRSARTYSPEVRPVKLVNQSAPRRDALDVKISGTFMKISSVKEMISLPLAQASCRHLGYDTGVLGGLFTPGSRSDKFSTLLLGAFIHPGRCNWSIPFVRQKG